MFEDAIFKKDESEVKRSFFTLPLAFAFQISVIVGFILFGIFTSTYIPAPEKNAVFEPVIIVPPPPPPLGTANGDNRPLKSVQQPKIEKNEIVFPEQKSDSSKNSNTSQPTDDSNQVGRGPRGDEKGDDFMNRIDEPPLPKDNSQPIIHPQISDISLIKALLAINTPKPAYPEPLLRMGVKGKVVALITVDQSGRVTNVEIEQSTNPLFEESVKETVKKWRFTSPVDKQGQKVSVIFRQAFIFNY